MFNKLTQFCQGRHTTFAILFSIVGSVFQWFHKLDATYVSFVTVMMGYILGHSVKEDYFAVKDQPKQ